MNFICEIMRLVAIHPADRRHNSPHKTVVCFQRVLQLKINGVDSLIKSNASTHCAQCGFSFFGVAVVLLLLLLLLLLFSVLSSLVGFSGGLSDVSICFVYGFCLTEREFSLSCCGLL